MEKKLSRCPVCNSTLTIMEYHCEHCGTTVRGNFKAGDLNLLTATQQEFVKVFICCHGNIKEVEKALGISYPTVKNRLTEVTKTLCGKDESKKKNDPLDALNALDEGKITIEEALNLLGGK